MTTTSYAEHVGMLRTATSIGADAGLVDGTNSEGRVFSAWIPRKRGKRSSTRRNACTAARRVFWHARIRSSPSACRRPQLDWYPHGIINGIIPFYATETEFASPTTSMSFLCNWKKLTMRSFYSVEKFTILFQNKIKLEFLNCTARFHQFWRHAYLFHRNIDAIRMFLQIFYI